MKKETETIIDYLKRAESLIASGIECDNSVFSMVMNNCHEILTNNTVWTTVMDAGYDDTDRSHDCYMSYLGARCRECSGLLADYMRFFGSGKAVKLVIDRAVNLLSSADKCIDASKPNTKEKLSERIPSSSALEYETAKWRNTACDEFYIIKAFILDFMNKNDCGGNDGFPDRCGMTTCPHMNGLCQFVKMGMELGKEICCGSDAMKCRSNDKSYISKILGTDINQ